jgi:alkylation response protein AidB-like acyl-CoA dehydrogenase
VNTSLTGEQVMLRRTMADLAGAHRVTGVRDLEDDVRARDAWSALREAGVLELRRRDGTGRPLGSAVDASLVAEALAYALVPTPYLGAGVLAAELLAAAGTSWLDELAGGDVRYGVCLNAELDDLATSDTLAGAVAWDVRGAQWALLLDADREELLRVPVPGSVVRDAADLTRDVVRLSGVVDAEGSGARLDADDLDRWQALAVTAACADALGVMRAALDLAVDYALEREAFGVPIGSFQALQHLLADAFAQVDTAADLTVYAAWAVDEAEGGERLLPAHTAKAYCARAVRDVTETAAQVFGGIGHTWEHVMHLYLRRAAVDRVLLGGESHHLRAIADVRLGAR